MPDSCDVKSNEGMQEIVMINTSSSEKCSTLVEYWASEYERLFGSTMAAEKLADIDQISPEEIKGYADNNNKWFGVHQNMETTEAKLAVLKRMEDWWKRNANTLSKLIKYMESTLLTFVLFLLVGCRSGLYQIDVDRNVNNKNDGIGYRIVNELNPEFYTEDYIPVVVDVKESDIDKSVTEGFAILTLGIIPAFYDYYKTIDVTVKTPIGVRSGSGMVHAKEWVGWICLIPYPGFATERSESPYLPNSAIEEKAKDQIIESLLSHFSKADWVAFVRETKEAQSRELKRVQKKKEELELLVEEGMYEDVIKACKEERMATRKDNPWSGIIKRTNTSLKNSIPVMDDFARLATLLSMVEDIAIKDAIVIRLNELGKCTEIEDDILMEYIVASTSEKGRVCAVGAIANEDDLVDVVRAKYSKAITIAAFKKLNVDKIQTSIFSGSSCDEDLLSWCIESCDTGQELISIVKLLGERLSDEKVEELIRTRTDSNEVIEELNRIKVARELAKMSYWDVNYGLFTTKLLLKIMSVSDKKYRTVLAEALLDRHMKAHEDRGRLNVYVGDDDTKVKHILRFTSLLSAKYSEKLFSNGFHSNSGFPLLCTGDAEWWHNTKTLVGGGKVDAFYVGLFKQMRKEEQQKQISVANERFNKKDRIHFNGFYVGMPYRDFVIMCGEKGCMPSQIRVLIDVWGSKVPTVRKIVFSRAARYAIFEKEDGEFWTAYLKEYVPVRKKQKSLSETIGDALDSSTFDYQSGWDNTLEESCYIYKSMKYGTKVIFGTDSGTLVLEEYK